MADPTNVNDACAKLPSASSDYQPTGTWETLADLKTYIVGSSNPKKAIIFIYDIFGVAPQSQQGADRLAASIPDTVVLMPDFFRGSGMNPAWQPPDTDEKKEAIAKFRAECAGIDPNVAKLLEVRQAAEGRWPTVGAEAWGVFGLCWGGKIGVLAAGAGNEGKGRRIAAAGTAHPARLEVADAEALMAPYICLASDGEPADVVAQYAEVLSKPGKTGVVETYHGMFHGWMGARAKLGDEKNRAEYERGYNQTAEFFAKHLL
ncbi:dienelactone hydrolase family protein [Xylariales sp. PMI_506]|nr:dienelactone hydrolase family protein [Xylariales sp. PMI_506]